MRVEFAIERAEDGDFPDGEAAGCGHAADETKFLVGNGLLDRRRRSGLDLVQRHQQLRVFDHGRELRGNRLERLRVVVVKVVLHRILDDQHADA